MDRVGESGLFGADLQAPAGGKGIRDGREAIGGGGGAGAERQVREIHGQPHVGRWCRQGGHEREIVLEHPVGDCRITHAFPEQVDADAVTLVQQDPDGRERAAARPARDVARSRPPRRPLTAGYALDRALQPLAGRQAKQNAPAEPHPRILAARPADRPARIGGRLERGGRRDHIGAMPAAENKALVRGFARRSGTRATSTSATMCSPRTMSVTISGLPSQPPGLRAKGRFAADLRSAFPDLRVSVDLRPVADRARLGASVQIGFLGQGWVLVQPSQGRIVPER